MYNTHTHIMYEILIIS